MPQDADTPPVTHAIETSPVSADFVDRERGIGKLEVALEDALAGNRPVLE